MSKIGNFNLNLMSDLEQNLLLKELEAEHLPADDNPKQIMPNDWAGFRLTSSFGNKLYGISQTGSKTLVVYDTITKVSTNINTFTDSSNPQKVFAIDDYLWFVVAELSDVYKLFRTADGGASFQFVQDFNNGITSSALLSNRSICQTPNGDLYYVDYNTNSTRTAGSTNDRIAAGTTLGASGINFVKGAISADNNLTQVAILDLASLSLSQVVKGSILAIPRGASTNAFDGYCIDSPRNSVFVDVMKYVF